MSGVEKFLAGPGFRLVLLARCSRCYRPVRTLLCPEAAKTVDEVVASAYWASGTGRAFRQECTCERPLPEPIELRSKIAQAVQRGLGASWEASSPITIRV